MFNPILFLLLLPGCVVRSPAVTPLPAGATITAPVAYALPATEFMVIVEGAFTTLDQPLCSVSYENLQGRAFLNKHAGEFHTPHEIDILERQAPEGLPLGAEVLKALADWPPLEEKDDARKTRIKATLKKNGINEDDARFDFLRAALNGTTGTQRKRALAKMQLKPKTVSDSKREVWSLGKTTLKVRAVPAKDQIFEVNPEMGPFKNTNVELKMNRDGLPTSFSGSTEDLVSPTVWKAIGTAGTVIGAAIPFGAEARKIARPSACDDARRTIIELNDALAALPRMKAAHSPEALTDRQKRLLVQRAQAEALFMGAPTVVPATIVCRIQPDSGAPTMEKKKDDEKKKFYPRNLKVDLIAFNKDKGMAANHAGCVIPEPLKADGATGTTLQLKVDELRDDLLLRHGAGWTPSEEPPGFVYRVPGRATASVVSIDSKPNEKTLVQPAVMDIPQWGVLQALPRTRGAKAALAVTVDEKTGALLSWSTTSTAPDVASGIDAAGAAAATILGAEFARQEVAAGKVESPHALILKQAEYLEALVAIETAKAALRD